MRNYKKLLFILTLFCLLGFTPPVAEYTPDDYTVLLIHAGEADGSTTPDDASASNHTITCVNQAQVDTAQYKFATGSILFDGTADYLSLDDSANWNFGSGDFTVDFWVRAAGAADATVLAQYVDDNNKLNIVFDTSGAGYIGLNCLSGGAWKGYIYAQPALSLNTWYHVAIARSGTTRLIYLDGVSQSVSGYAWDTLPDLAVVLTIGGSASYGDLNGWMDEVRISKGIARDWAVARRVINIAYGVNIGSPNMIGTPLWSCKIKLECMWRNWYWKLRS